MATTYTIKIKPGKYERTDAAGHEQALADYAKAKGKSPAEAPKQKADAKK